MEWRLLKADEIEIRTGQKNKDKTRQTLLLYKDARCDMDRLDEQFGQYGWQRLHKDVHGVTYCGVALRDPSTGEWVEKWDAGANDNEGSMGNKGEASDSFKRACVNWGIGRELYSAPTIWVDAAIDPRKLRVHSISYNDAREIMSLCIMDENNAVIYQTGAYVKSAPKAAPTPKAEPAVVIPTPQIQKEAKVADDDLSRILADISAAQTMAQLEATMARVSENNPYIEAIKHAANGKAKQNGWRRTNGKH